jgi:hypothetical protein
MSRRALATVVGILAFTIVPGPASAGSAGRDVQASLSAAAASRAVAVSGPIISVIPLALNFGVVSIGEQATREYTIQNVGDEDLEIAAIFISNPQITTNALVPLVVHPGGSFPAIATYAPSGGALAATLEFRSNSSFGPFTINASGRANSAPVLHPIGPLSAFAYVELRVTVTASDPDTDPVSFVAQGLPVGATFDEEAGEFAWTPVPTDEGVHTVSFVATDGFASDNETVAITVTVPIHPPILQQPADMTVIALGTADQTLTATDPDGDPLSYSKVSGPSYVTVPTTNPGSGSTIGRIHLEPGILDAVSTPVTVRVSDGTLSDQKSLTVTIVSSHAGGEFGAPVNSGTGGLFLGFGVGDLSGDGRLDVAVAHPISGTVSVHLGNGDGSFGATTDYAAGIQPVSIAVGDLNGDGWLDLAVTNSGVSVLLGGSGGFGDKTDYAAGGQPRAVVVGDLNGDGRLDLAVTNAASNTVSVLLGNGDGTFGAKTDYGTEPGPGPIAVGDLNGDRRLDLAVANVSSGTVSVFLGEGDGSLGPRADYPTGCEAHSVAMGDLNGDGKLDLAVQNGCSNTLSILFGNGDGSFRAKTDYGVGGNGVAIRDLNGDGRLDLLAAQGTSVSVLLNQSPDAGEAGDVIYSNFGPSKTFDTDPEHTWTINGFLGPTVGQQGIAHQFTPNVTSTFLSAEIALTLYNGPSAVGVFLQADSIGLPGPVLEHIDVAGLTSVPTVFRATSHLQPQLRSGTPYWLTVVAGGAGVLAGWNWNSTGDASTGTNFAGTQGGGPTGPWGLNSEGSIRSAFQINGRLKLEAAVDLDPNVINLKSHAPWVTAYIEPSGFDASSIDFSTLRLAGSVPAAPKFATVGDHNRNGTPDLMVKFSRAALDPLLTPGVVELEVTGSLLTGEGFTGSDEVRVIHPPAAHLTASVTPNPLNPSGVLSFETSRPGPVRATIFDVRGRKVRVLMDTPTLPMGSHAVPIDGRGDRGQTLASGVYFFRVEAAEEVATGRIVVMK